MQREAIRNEIIVDVIKKRNVRCMAGCIRHRKPQCNRKMALEAIDESNFPMACSLFSAMADYYSKEACR